MAEGMDFLPGVLDGLQRMAAGHSHSPYMMLEGEAIVALWAEVERLQTQEKRLSAARRVLVEDGYFTPDGVGDDLAPRLIEWLSHHRGRMTATTRIEIDDDVLWARMLPRLERWADDRSRRDRAAFAAMPRMTW